jgi:hypothetical protein
MEAAEGADNKAHVHHGSCCSHDHSDEIKVYKLPTLTKLAACEAFKIVGLGYFQETQWKRAHLQFQKILVYLDYTFPSSPEEEHLALVLRRGALLNSCVCVLKQGELREAIKLANQVCVSVFLK